jgi:hypothetical protein
VHWSGATAVVEEDKTHSRKQSKRGLVRQGGVSLLIGLFGFQIEKFTICLIYRDIKYAIY